MTIETQQATGKKACFGTGGGTRTPKMLPPADFESAASTSSATPAIRRGF